MDKNVNLNFFAPFVNALSEYGRCCTAYLDAYQNARDFLDAVIERQRKQTAIFEQSLVELKEEEEKNSQFIKKEVERRTRCLLWGVPFEELQPPVEKSLENIREMIAIANRLVSRKYFTPDEREQWENTVEVLDATASNLRAAVKNREAEQNKLSLYLDSIKLWGAGTPCIRHSSLIEEAYELNKDWDEEYSEGCNDEE